MRLLPAFLLLASGLFAQVPGQFAAEPAVLTRFNYTISMQPDGTGYRERTASVRIQSEAAVHEFSVLSFPFAGASEHVELHYLRVRHADGSVVETPATDAQEQPTAVTREAPFYSDSKEKQVPVRGLRVGDTLEWQVRIVRTKPEAPGQFWGEDNFSDALVTLEETVELHIAKDSPVHVWTNPNEAQATETTTATERVYRWQHHNLKPTTGPVADVEKEDAKRHTLTPEEELDLREGKLPAYAWSTFPSWAAVGDWYRALERDRHTPDADIKAKVAELTAGKTTLESRVRAVYDYDALQVRYVGVAFGVGRYQPHPASEVLSNQYGDCKDKHTLLAAMLAELGLHPDAVLIGQGVRFNPDLPSPGAFNHLITQVTVDGQPAWLDATAETAPYRFLLSPLRDKQALVIPDSGPAHLERTPKDPPFAPFEEMKAVGSLNKDGISESHLTLTLRGDEEVYVRAVLRQLPPAKYDAFVQQLSAGMGYGGTSTHASFSNLADTSIPLTIAFDYHREKAGDWDNYRIIPQLLPIGLQPVDEKDPPKQSIPLGFVTTTTSLAEMKLPEGWSAELPEAVHQKTSFATYDETYRLDHGTLYTERKVSILTERIPARDWKQYKDWGDKVNLAGDLYVQLLRGTGPAGKSSKPAAKTPAVPPPSAPKSSSDAERLVREAYTAMQYGEMNKATTLLDQAKAINPAQRGLWVGYAMLHGTPGHAADAIADLQHELELNPGSTSVYPLLANLQRSTGQTADAVSTLRHWREAAPEDPQPVGQLVSLLDEEGRPADAVAAAEEALPNLPEDARKNPALLTAYGSAQLKAGQGEAGLKTLHALLEDTSDPSARNSAAYALAEAGKELPLAETTERELLARLDTETRSWTGKEAAATIKAKSSLLFASWDTLGWILFREAKLAEAEAAVDASFRNRPSTVVGEHLGDIRAAAGDPAGARRAYSLALAALPTRHGAPESPAAAAARKSLEAKAAGKSASEATLDDLRKVPLGPAGGRNGAAEYRVLLTPKGVTGAEPTGDKSLPNALPLLQSAKLPRLFPTGSEAQLVKFAILNCHSGTCDLIFEP